MLFLCFEPSGHDAGKPSLKWLSGIQGFRGQINSIIKRWVYEEEYYLFYGVEICSPYEN